MTGFFSRIEYLKIIISLSICLVYYVFMQQHLATLSAKERKTFGYCLFFRALFHASPASRAI